jgi:hypothetical protein
MSAMDRSPRGSQQGLTAADVMLATPKTLSCNTTVAEARTALASEHVPMLLLTECAVFRGAVTSIPEHAEPPSPALPQAYPAAETIAPTESAEAAYEPTFRRDRRLHPRSSPVEKGNGERVSADGPDAVDLGPAVGAGIEQAGDAAEPLEQDTSSSSRDPRHGGENLDARHRSV